MRKSHKESQNELQNLACPAPPTLSRLKSGRRASWILLLLLVYIFLSNPPSLSSSEPPEVTNEFVVTAASMTLQGVTLALGIYHGREVVEMRADNLELTDVHITRFEITGDIVATNVTNYCTFIEGTLIGPTTGEISWRPGESISSLVEGDISMENVGMHLLRMELGTLEISEMVCAMPYSEDIVVTFPHGEVKGWQIEGPLPYDYLIDGETVTVKVTETKYNSLETGSVNMLCEQADNKWQMSATAMTVESSTTCAVYTKIAVKIGGITIMTLDWDGDEVPDIANIPLWLLELFGVEECPCRSEGCEGCICRSGDSADFSDVVMRDVYMGISKITMTNMVTQVVFPEPPPEEGPEVDKLLLVNNYFAIGRGWTTIWYAIEKPRNVTLKIYTRHGRLVKTLIEEYKTEGTDSEVWIGKNEEGEDVAAGIYFVHLKAPGISVIKKICVVK